MKRGLNTISLLFLSTLIFAQARYWVGPTSGGLWSSASNWSLTSGGAGGASVPTSANDVIFNSAFNGSVEMDNLTSPAIYTINSLLITNNATVTLKKTQIGGGTRTLEVASVSPTTPGLKITSGSTLIFDPNNTSTSNTSNSSLDFIFSLTGAAGVTGEISGNLYFQGDHVLVPNPTPPPNDYSQDGESHLNLSNGVSNYASLAVKNGGVIKYFDNSGNTSPATGNYLTMESGSIYEVEKNGGSFPPGSWDPNSLARASGFGTDPASFNGTSYGNLEWNRLNQLISGFFNANISFNNVNLVSTNGQRLSVKTGTSAGNYTMTINGNLDINSGAYLEMISNSALSGSSGKVSLKGNLNNQGTLGTNGVPGTTGQFEFSGSSNQNITNNGFFIGVRFEFIMNGLSVTLLTPLILPGDNNATNANLQLLNGKIITTSTNILSMIDNATVSGGSSNSFVSGPMKKTGNDNFIFPVGKGSIYAPIGIINSAGQATGDQYTAEYIRGNPQSVHGTNYQSPINHISYVEYWTLDRNSGSATKQVSLAVNYASFCYNLSKTYVSRYNGTQWTYEGSTNAPGPTSPPYVSGTITSVNIISSFSPAPNAFTLSTDLPFSANPLPITLITFDAFKISSSASSINWQLAACCSPDAKFEVQRAGSDKAFTTIGSMPGSATNKSYNYADNNLLSGINYYRLKMIDENGKVSYSRTVAVINGAKGLLLTSLIPTIVTHNATLTIASCSRQQLDIIIIDAQGRTVRKQNLAVNPGNTTIELPLSTLASGIYYLQGIAADSKTNTIRFIR